MSERFARQVEALAVVTELVEVTGCHTFLVDPHLFPAPYPFIVAMPDLIFSEDELDTFECSDVGFDEERGSYVVWQTGRTIIDVPAEAAAKIIISEYREWERKLLAERTSH